MENILVGKNVKFPQNVTLTEYFEQRLISKTNGLHPLINPNNIGLIEEGKPSLTFREISDLSTKVAYVIKNIFLKDHLVQPNEDGDYLIGVCITPSIDLILGLFGILKLGAGYVPFNASFPDDRIKHMFNSSKPFMIICDDERETLKKFDKIKHLVKILTISEIMKKVQELNGNEMREIETFPSKHEKIAAVLFTSGSTGSPKGVRVTHRASMHRIYWEWRQFPFKSYECERNSLKTTLTFCDSLWEIFGPLLHGRSLTLLTREMVSNPSIFLEKIKKHSITRLFISPVLLRAIFSTIKLIGEEKGKSMLKSVYFLASSADTLTKDVVQEFYKYFPENCVIANFFGSTEIFDVTTQVIYGKHDVEANLIKDKIPLGRPIYNTSAYVLDENLNLLHRGEIGEIYFSGPNLALGYAGVKYSEKFIENPFSNEPYSNTLYKTGDLGHFETSQSGDLVLMLCGRIDTQVKVRCYRVDLNEIQASIYDKNLIDKCMVLCYKRGEIDQKIVAFVVKNEGVENAEILEMFKEKLREYEIPELRVLKEIPVMSNDKTDRQKMLKDYENEIFNKGSFEKIKWEELGITQETLNSCKALVETVSDLIGISFKELSQNLDSSFYSIGGNSLNSIEAVACLRSKNYFIDIGDFLYTKSLREIINLMKLKPEDDIPILRRESEDLNYNFEDMKDSHREEVIKIISESFSEKGDLEQYNKITYEAYHQMLSSIWDFLVKNGLSSILRRNSDDKIIGAILSCDYFEHPNDMEITSKELGYDLEIQEYLELPQIVKLDIKGTGSIFHAALMGTRLDLDAIENVRVMEIMSEKTIEKARNLGFKGMIACDTSPLTKQLGKLHGWETFQKYQINQFAAKDGVRPFKEAPDNVIVHVNWKNLN